jgi:hypothetical protein
MKSLRNPQRRRNMCSLRFIDSALVISTFSLPLQVLAQPATPAADQLSNKSPALQQREQGTQHKRGPNTNPPQGIAGAPANDDCENAIAAFDGNNPFSTIGATTDGPPHASCDLAGESQINQDIWFDYTATSTDVVNISLCGSAYNTRLAMYAGCACPVGDDNLIACNDDACGLQSETFFSTTAGECYKVRIGGFDSSAGEGNVLIFVGCVGLCGPCARHDCCTTGWVGCNDAECCNLVCAKDAFCCDIEWDTICVNAADELCGNAPQAYCPSPCTNDNPQDCFVGGNLPGCSIPDCCEFICAFDPFCCNAQWDQTCADAARAMCDLACEVTCLPGATLEDERCGEDNNGSCGGSFGSCQGPFPDCCDATGAPGCSDPACQQSICTIDPYCCDTEWDGICAAEACDDPNCQCNPSKSLFQTLACSDSICGTHWSSTTVRDTDWYQFNITECGTLVTWNVNSEFPPAVFVVQGCPGTILAAGLVNGCDTTASVELAAGTYLAFVAPAAFVNFPCGIGNNNYVAQLTCAQPCAGDIIGASGSPDGAVNVDDLLKVINNWGACK